MFDPNKFKPVRVHSSMIYIDEKMTITDMKSGCPLFFNNARKSEKRKAYRGCIITQENVKFSTHTENKICVFAYDNRNDDTHCLSSNCKTIDEAKALIKKTLDTPQEKPLTLTYKEVSVPMIVKVKVAVFVDADNVPQSAEIVEWLGVDGMDKRNYNAKTQKPGDIICSEVWSKAVKLATEQF